MTVAELIAETLVAAEHGRSPVPPVTRTYPHLSMGIAYAAQAVAVDRRLAAGERPIGAKLGLTSAITRHVLGIKGPVHGRLTSGMLVAFGEPVRMDELISPRAEPEIALLIGSRLAGPTTVADVLAATEAVVPAVEIVDSRYATSFQPFDSVADNLGAARVVLGNGRCRPADLPDLDVLGCVFRHRRGIDTAAGGAAMGHPAAAVAWLAAALAGRGSAIEAGDVVLTGGLTASVPLGAGDVVTAEFDGLGSISVRAA